MVFGDGDQQQAMISQMRLAAERDIPPDEVEAVVAAYRQLLKQLRPLIAMDLGEAEPAPRYTSKEL